MTCAIIGLGNPLMGDDGAGPAALERLRRAPLPEGVLLVEGGTAGMGLLHILAGLDAAVLVDALDFGGQPGEIRTLHPSEVFALTQGSRLSLHDADVLQVIALAKRLGQCPGQITLCVIQPDRIAPGWGLSPRVKARLPALARAARNRAVAMSAPLPPSAPSEPGVVPGH